MRFLLDTNSFFLAKPFLKEEVGKFLKSWQYFNAVWPFLLGFLSSSDLWGLRMEEQKQVLNVYT